MGNKSGRISNSAGADAPKSTAFVLKVPMHCRCKGCRDKIHAAVNDLKLRYDGGIVSLDDSALATHGDVAVVATVNPERLCRRLRKDTGKKVGLVFAEPPAAAADDKDDAAAVQELLRLDDLPLQQVVLEQLQPVHHGHPPPPASWNALQPGVCTQTAYPWVQQQPVHHGQAPHPASWNTLQPGVYTQAAYPPEPPYYPAAAYPTASWGASDSWLPRGTGTFTATTPSAPPLPVPAEEARSYILYDCPKQYPGY